MWNTAIINKCLRKNKVLPAGAILDNVMTKMPVSVVDDAFILLGPNKRKPIEALFSFNTIG